MPSAARAASLSVATGADPVEDTPVQLSVSGSADAATSLWVFVGSSALSCPATPADARSSGSWTSLSSYYGDSVSSGALSRTYSTTPDSTAGRRICAYLATAANGPVTGQTSTTFVARQPRSTVAFSFSADQVEDTPGQVTVSGAAEVARSLFVVRLAAGRSCPSTTQDARSAGELLSSYYGDQVGAGDYSRTYSYTPTDPGTVLVCAYIDEGASAAAPETSGSSTTTVRAPHSSAAIGFSADAREDTPVSVQVTGNTEVTRSLFAAVVTTASCPATTQDARSAGQLLSSYYGDQIAAGDYARTYTFTPATSGTYRVCAYVDEGASAATPEATATKTVAVRAPRATVASTESADPTEDRPVTVTVQGTTEVDRTLFAAVTSTAADCPQRATDVRSRGQLLTSYYGDSVTAGSFQRTYSFTPADSAGYRVCTYVTEGAEAAANAVGAQDFAARQPRSAVQVRFESDPVAGQRQNISVSGSTEVDRTLFVSAVTGAADCPDTASDARGSAIALTNYYGDAVSAGDFSKSYSFTPDTTTAYRLCAYVTEDAAAAPEATGTDQRGTAPPEPAATTSTPAAPIAPTTPPVTTTPVRPTLSAGTAPRVHPLSGTVVGAPRRGGVTSVKASLARLPLGVSAEAWTAAVARSAARWGLTYAGTTTAGAGSNDGQAVIGFSTRLDSDHPVAIATSYSAKLKKAKRRCRRYRDPKTGRRKRTCGTQQSFAATPTVDRDALLALNLSWNPTLAPTGGRWDLETAVLYALGRQAGNPSVANRCTNSPLVAPDAPADYWYSSTDSARRGC